MFRLGLFFVFVVLAWVYWPVTGADFVIDDYVFIATSRMVENPLAALWQSHFYEPYYFRPFGLLSWWAATRAFGLDYQAHSLINLLIHGANVGLLGGLLRLLGARKWAALAAAALFAFAPFSLAASLWPSNRFDLLAVLFLLCTAISLLKVLRGASLRWWFALGLSALAACWSKELAFPAATLMACLALLYVAALWRVRVAAFALLGVVISAAFFWRHALIAQPYAVVGGDPWLRIVEGGRVWASAAGRFWELSAGGTRGVALLWVLGVVLLLALIGPVKRDARRFFQSSGLVTPRWRLVVAAALVWLLISVAQMPLAGAFAPMLDGGVLGTVTYARFYYGSTAALAVVIGLLLARARASALASSVVLLMAISLGIGQRALGDSFASWTRAEIRPVAVAATAIADSAEKGEPCVLVFLGAHATHPWFRMFSDVTVKARTERTDSVWRCHVLTESTPWIFAFPLGVVPADLGLPAVPDTNGVKPDSVWSTVRYRYRLAPKDAQSLPTARFFEWKSGRFVEVTSEVRSGARAVTFRGW